MGSCVYCGGNTYAHYQYGQVIDPPRGTGSHDVLAVCASCEEEHILPAVRLPDGALSHGPRESWNEPSCEVCQELPRFFVIAIFPGYAVLDEEAEKNPKEFWAENGVSMREAKRQADELAAQWNREADELALVSVGQEEVTCA